ncbi:MAG: arginine repressor [Limnochordia bacterium]|nr:arginine repressor [Limnochordia bacterium]MDI9465287.1 arginine repressor [Bacillota bacterium]NLO94741.1 arginine repressor [Bacillota bacterium]HOB40029.1 arginine repressor [Limnochordia bacterium]HOK31148.1 arginine repressor [Limnochordia bacterium]
MKHKRQSKLLELVRQHNVETQEALMELLQAHGFRVTQATISRDIKELRLVKVPNGQGGYKYSLPSTVTMGDLLGRARRIFRDYVRSVDFSGPFILIKTYPGGAHAVAAIIDELEWPEMLGSIAGDDSILILTHDPQNKPSQPEGPAGLVFSRIQELMER